MSGSCAAGARTCSESPQQAIAQAEEKDGKHTATPLFGRTLVFAYGGVSEEIIGPQMTFDQLRQEKARDSSELEEAAKVPWRIKYGKTSCTI